MKPIISIKDIYKSYEEVEALSGISIDIHESEIFGFIGPDGAGKTTLMRILTTLILADKGVAHIMGYDVVNDFKTLRSKLGYMPGRFSLYQDLSVEENLNFFAGIFKTTVKENYHLIKDIYHQIEPFKKRRAGDLSGGMKQKLALSCALIHQPQVLILDEPTTGVDAVSRTEFWNMLQKLKEQGMTIVVSTPYMDEAARCDRIALIQKGKIMSVDKPERIVLGFKDHLYGLKAENMYQLVKRLRAYHDSISVYLFGEWVHFSTKKPVDESDLKSFLLADGIKDYKIKELQANIEDSFMDLMIKTENEADNS